MARTMTFSRKPAQTGKASSLVIFLHGYGSNGADLFSLADVMAPHLPGTAFVAPDAPTRVQGAPNGFQWLPIPRWDGSTEADVAKALLQITDDLSAFIDQRLSYEGLPPEAVALLGFSQGAMMALHVAPRRATAMAAVVAISGRLMVPETLVAETRAKPPIMLIHGDQDDVVPFGNLAFAGDELTKAGFNTYAHVMKGTGHGIAPDGLEVALSFLANFLPK
jgi:phospholipase/carboxylesterase